MILIDGIIGSLNDVNPNDIESVSVFERCLFCFYIWLPCSKWGYTYYNKKGNKGRIKVSYSGFGFPVRKQPTYSMW